jgi:hypothetical protein
VLVAAISPEALPVETTSARAAIVPASKTTPRAGEILSFTIRNTNGFHKQISKFFTSLSKLSLINQSQNCDFAYQWKHFLCKKPCQPQGKIAAAAGSKGGGLRF